MNKFIPDFVTQYQLDTVKGKTYECSWAVWELTGDELDGMEQMNTVDDFGNEVDTTASEKIVPWSAGLYFYIQRADDPGMFYY